MRRLTTTAGLALFAAALLGEHAHLGGSEQRASSAAQRIDLAERLQSGKLRAVNRDASRLQGTPDGVHVSEREGPGVVWIEGTDFAEGTIQLDVRGRDVPQRSFVGVAFHGRGDNAYEAVYLRPFNFRNPDAARRQNALQYMMLPEYDWPRLRKEFPSEFENPVDPSIVPTEWVPLRVEVSGKTIRVYAGPATSPALEARKLGAYDRGAIGLWVGNNSEGDFANLTILPASNPRE